MFSFVFRQSRTCLDHLTWTQSHDGPATSCSSDFLQFLLKLHTVILQQRHLLHCQQTIGLSTVRRSETVGVCSLPLYQLFAGLLWDHIIS